MLCVFDDFYIGVLTTPFPLLLCTCADTVTLMDTGQGFGQFISKFGEVEKVYSGGILG